MICWLLVALLVAHVIVTAAGFLFTEAEILRDQLLNQMEEGLIIIDESCDKVLFENKAAADLRKDSGNLFIVKAEEADKNNSL